jgi:hypothetical protein
MEIFCYLAECKARRQLEPRMLISPSCWLILPFISVIEQQNVDSTRFHVQLSITAKEEEEEEEDERNQFVDKYARISGSWAR